MVCVFGFCVGWCVYVDEFGLLCGVVCWFVLWMCERWFCESWYVVVFLWWIFCDGWFYCGVLFGNGWEGVLVVCVCVWWVGGGWYVGWIGGDLLYCVVDDWRWEGWYLCGRLDGGCVGIVFGIVVVFEDVLCIDGCWVLWCV